MSIRTDGGNGQKEKPKPRKDKDLMKEFNKELQRAVGRDEKQHYKDICKTSKMETGREKPSKRSPERGSNLELIC